MPAAVAISFLFANTGDIALGVSDLKVYSTGFRFKLRVWSRTHTLDRIDERWGDLVLGSHTDIPLEKRLLLGLEFADGRTATNLDFDPYSFEEPWSLVPDDVPMLCHFGGTGSPWGIEDPYWMDPLPPPGPLAFICTWPLVGVPETRVTVDGTAIVEAAARSIVLWEPAEPEPEEPRPPTPPPRPTTGWFSHAIRGAVGPETEGA